MKQKFFNLLEDLFIGARVKGDTGISNFLDLKAIYFKKFQKELEEKMDEVGKAVYDRLYTFFRSYFNESGSLFFANTPKWEKRYARISNKDVELFYKTKELYYIKSQKIYDNLDIEIDENRFYFDATLLGDRIGNEKKEVEFLFSDVKDDKLVFLVRYKTNQKYDILKEITQKDKPEKAKDEILNNFESYIGRVEFEKNYVFENLDKFKNRDKISSKNFEFIIKEIEKNGLFSKIKITLTLKDSKNIKKLISIDEKVLEKAFKTYNKQANIDYFIHKDAKNFLKEQFDLWVYDYVANDIDTVFNIESLNEIHKIKKIAYELIDKIADFEDEIKAVWLKPRFAINSNYVITKDRLEKYEILDKFLTHSNINEQIKEWQELNLVDEKFSIEKISDEKYRYLPFDTKYFKDIEIELLEKIDNLDDELDGRLIKSENFQALNTLLPKYRNQIDLIYIDPPYNAPASEIIYINSFKHSTWLTMMENRIVIAKQFLKKDGIFECAIDDNEQERLGILLEEIFPNYEKTCITIIHNPSGTQKNNFLMTNEFTYFLYKKDVKINPEKRTDKEADVRNFMNTAKGNTENYMRYTGKNCFYPIIVDKNTLEIVKFGEVCEDDFHPHNSNITNGEYVYIYPIDEQGIERKWVFERKNVEKIKNELFVRKMNNKFRIYRKKNFINFKSVWTNSKYSAKKYGTELLTNYGLENFDFPKSIWNVYDCIYAGASNNKNSCILDFFAGSGTTADAVIRLNKNDGGNRKFLLIEMGEHFNNVILPRVKKLCVSLNYTQGYPQDRDGNSLFFKYYSLEQFEDILKKAEYKNSLETSPKMSYATEIDFENEKLFYAFEKLYPNIDIVETISNLVGEKIVKITRDKIILENREIDLDDLTFENYPELKPLIYWS